MIDTAGFFKSPVADRIQKQETGEPFIEHESPVASIDTSDAFVHDPARSARLRRKFDRRILPICAWFYLMNYLDRGNIGNAKVLNSETGDSLLQRTRMTNTDYAIVVSLFGAAYAIFEVPSNFVMKRYVRPSLWLGVLLFCWGSLTMAFAGVRNYASVAALRFLIGAFEAGFFPGMPEHVSVGLDCSFFCMLILFPQELCIISRSGTV